jgi:hypothetical protein
MMVTATAATAEKFGPAERIIGTLLAAADHMSHGRPGVVTADGRTSIGARWEFCTHVVENGQKVVYLVTKSGKKTVKTRIGVLRETDNKVLEGARVVCEYRSAGIFLEAAVWMYSQVVSVWKLDNEFAARWASYAFTQEHRDLKVVLAAFLLVQSRKGDPITENGKLAFHDDDFRDVGEAMMLTLAKGKDFNPRMLLRIKEVLELPGVVEINRALGFGVSARRAFLGRWTKAVTMWLRYREDNPKLLEGLVKAGFRRSVADLAKSVGYKPQTAKFFQTLRWKQSQAADGRRSLAIGVAVQPTVSWETLSEGEICERIVKDKPTWKTLVGSIPAKLGLTRAIAACAVESGCVSNKEMIILTPTFEELGLLEVKEVKEKWERALKSAEDDVRAANIARNVKTTAAKEQLQAAADTALAKKVEEVTKGLRIYVIVDISGSMQHSIDRAKELLAKFLHGFPLEQLHVSVFNTSSRVISLKHKSATGVEQAFKGITASGGTSHSAGILSHVKSPPKADEDSIFIFVGDGGEHGSVAAVVRQSGLRPSAFGFLKLPGDDSGCIERTATELGIPCFRIDERTFDDVYAIPRTIRALVAATPVGVPVVTRTAPVRLTLVDQILKTTILRKPAWAITLKPTLN